MESLDRGSRTEVSDHDDFLADMLSLVAILEEGDTTGRGHVCSDI